MLLGGNVLASLETPAKRVTDVAASAGFTGTSKTNTSSINSISLLPRA
jgi:hypothetical protein